MGGGGGVPNGGVPNRAARSASMGDRMERSKTKEIDDVAPGRMLSISSTIFFGDKMPSMRTVRLAVCAFLIEPAKKRLRYLMKSV